MFQKVSLVNSLLLKKSDVSVTELFQEQRSASQLMATIIQLQSRL